jgi:hypothetical protein
MQMFHEGGWSMYLVLVTGLLHAIPVVVQLAMVKKADFTPYLWGGLAGIALIGLLGALIGLSQGLSAIGWGAPEQTAALIARGIAIALNNGVFTAIIVLPGVFFTGIASSLTRNLTPVRLKD